MCEIARVPPSMGHTEDTKSQVRAPYCASLCRMPETMLGQGQGDSW